MEGAPIVVIDDDLDDQMNLPPGFRFHPTDEEIITHYLTKKVMDSKFTAIAIAEVDMNKCEPWDLPRKANMGEKEHFFFCKRDRKYPTGTKTNRATESGYWKVTGKDKEIYKGKGCLVGMIKTLVFYTGRAPKGEKTNWMMREYRLEGRFSYSYLPKGAKDEWVVCKVFHKNVGAGTSPLREISQVTRVNSNLDNLLEDSPTLPSLMDIPSSSQRLADSSFSTDDCEFKAATTSAGKSSYHGNLSSDISTNLNNYSKLQIQQDQNSFLMPTFGNYAVKTSCDANSNHSDDSYSIFSPPISISATSYPFSGFKATPDHHQATSSAYSAANQRILDPDRQYKVEQFSYNNSLVSPSQETGINNDIAPEISSGISKKNIENKFFAELEDIFVDPSMSDLDSLWEY